MSLLVFFYLQWGGGRDSEGVICITGLNLHICSVWHNKRLNANVHSKRVVGARAAFAPPVSDPDVMCYYLNSTEPAALSHQH